MLPHMGKEAFNKGQSKVSLQGSCVVDKYKWDTLNVVLDLVAPCVNVKDEECVVACETVDCVVGCEPMGATDIPGDIVEDVLCNEVAVPCDDVA